jgi:hypothetical protein
MNFPLLTETNGLLLSGMETGSVDREVAAAVWPFPQAARIKQRIRTGDNHLGFMFLSLRVAGDMISLVREKIVL